MEVCHRYGFFYYSLEKIMPSDRGQPSWQRQVISDGRKNMISPGVKIGDRDVAFALGNHVPKTLKQKLLQHSVHRMCP